MKSFTHGQQQIFWCLHRLCTITVLEEKTKERGNYMPIILIRSPFVTTTGVHEFSTILQGSLRHSRPTKDDCLLKYQINDRGSFQGAKEVLIRDPFLKMIPSANWFSPKDFMKPIMTELFKEKVFVADAANKLSAKVKLRSIKPGSRKTLEFFSKLAAVPAPFFEPPWIQNRISAT